MVETLGFQNYYHTRTLSGSEKKKSKSCVVVHKQICTNMHVHYLKAIRYDDIEINTIKSTSNTLKNCTGGFQMPEDAH